MTLPRSWTRRRVLLVVLGVVAISGVVIGAVAYVKFLREAPAPFFASEEEHFLYGSVGTEREEGIPYWIWLVLPRLFPEYLPRPGGYAALGVPSVGGHEMPVGLSKVTIGFPRVAINCAMCHAASYRVRPDDPVRIVPAAASHQMAPQMYFRFLVQCASDPRFNADTILAEIARNHELSLLDRILYRFLIIPGTRRGLLRVRDRDAWMNTRPEWGRGRIDPFNRVKFTFLRQPIDDTIGNSDMVPIWNMKARQGHALHWDGLVTSLQEAVLSSALGDGATRKWVDRDFEKWNATDPREMSSLRRVMNYISDVQPPAYPFPIDAELAASGETTYKAECASCHDVGGERTGTVVPASETGTDTHRLAMWTRDAAAAYNAYGDGHAWKFSAFRKTNGYVSTPLDGLWLRAPYLHNGSVPSLADLLEKPEQRPSVFWRGYDLYDAEKVGFVSTGAEAERLGTKYDTSLPANSNAGHLYGTDLSAEAKRALIEYLKTR